MLKPKTFESSDLDEASAKDEYSVFDCEDTENDYASSIYSSFKEAKLSSRREAVCLSKAESPLKVINYSALMRKSPDMVIALQSIPSGIAHGCALSPHNKSTFYQLSARKCEIIEEEPLRISAVNPIKREVLLREACDESSCSMVKYEGSIDL